MNATLGRQIWLRAGNRCEYCLMPQEFDETSFEIDHVISRKHGGPTALNNLALSCFWCNAFKGSDIASRDAKTRKLTPHFNPRRHKWNAHFRWGGSLLIGRTAIGRLTIMLLNINDAFRVELRETLMAEGVFPTAS